MKILIGLIFFGIFIFTLSIKAIADDPADVTKMLNMSLEDLMNTKVTSAAGREQKLDDVANAMYVITTEDIERSGARNVADLLYRVPGLQVRQIDSNQYGVGIRENGTYTTNNLLVLIDGAVVFNPLFGGAIWENLPVSLNEIERIEIIRGSPGVLYSSNAVNGVINIITKAADVKDNYVEQEGGTQSFRDSSIGVGAEKIGSTGLALRAYLDNQFEQGFPKNTSGSFSERYLSDRDGVRMDYTPSDHQRLSVIANNNQQNSNSPNVDTGLETKGTGQTTSAIVNYTDQVTDMYDYSLHLDHVEQMDDSSLGNTNVHTTSATTQHNFHYDFLGSNITSVGGELRYNAVDATQMSPTIPLYGVLNCSKASQKIISFFAQDEYRPIEKLILTAGVREDSNSFVINEKPLYSPKVSALYHLADNQSLWASSGKDYRTPDFLDRDLSLGEDPLFDVILRGSTDLKPEENLTQEVGYRTLLLDQKLKTDMTLFSTKVKNVIDLDDGSLSTFNNGSLTTKGAELGLNYQYTNELSFSTDYSYVYPHSKPETKNDSTTLGFDTSESNNIVGIGTRYTLNKFKFDLYAKYYEGYVIQNVQTPNIKIRGYYDSSMRLSYDFQTPACGKLGKLDATVYLDVNEFLGARQPQSTLSGSSSNEKFIRPEFTAGIKVRF